MKNLKRILILSLALLVFAFSFPPDFLSAQNAKDSLQCGVNSAAGAPGCGAPSNPETTANRIIRNIINLFTAVVGIVAVVMIILAGFRYVTSGGSSDKVASAKNALMYAVIGLVIVALAQVMVRYVLGQAVAGNAHHQCVSGKWTHNQPGGAKKGDAC